MTGIAEWLASLGLSEYAQCFAENAVDLSVVQDLTEQDLKDLGRFARTSSQSAARDCRHEGVRCPDAAARA